MVAYDSRPHRYLRMDRKIKEGGKEDLSNTRYILRQRCRVIRARYEMWQISFLRELIAYAYVSCFLDVG